MKKVFSNKYFLLIWLTVVAIFNAVLFLIVNQFNQELLKLTSFWVLYGCVMLFFVIIGSLAFIYNRHETNQSLFTILVIPASLIAILLGIILFFFVEHILSVIIIVIYVILLGFVVMGFILGGMYQSHLNNVPKKTVEVISMNGLKAYLNELMNGSANNAVNEMLEHLLDKTNISVQNPDNEELKALEKRIFEYALFLKRAIDNNSVNNFLFNAEKMEKLLEQRGNY